MAEAKMQEAAADVKAGLALIESVNELLEQGQPALVTKVQGEFQEILDVLEEREAELLEKAAKLNSDKLDELEAHALKLQQLVEDIAEPDLAPAVIESAPHPRLTAELVVLADPTVKQDQERFDRAYAGLGSIDNLNGVPVEAMFEAAVSQPAAKGFFRNVLGLLAQIDTSEEAGLVTPDDMEMLVAMLEEFKGEDVMADASPAICNLAGSSPQLSRKFVEEGAVPAMLAWFDEYQTSEKVTSGAAFALGVLAKESANQAAMLEGGVIEKLLGTMKAAPDDASVAENCLFTLSSLIMVGPPQTIAVGRDQFVEGEGVELVGELMGQLDSHGFLANALKAMAAVAKGGVDYQQLLMDSGIVDLAITCLQDHSSAPRVVEQACACIEAVLADQKVVEGVDQKARRREVIGVLVKGGAFMLMMEAVGEFNTNQPIATVVCSIFEMFGVLAKKKDVSKSGLILGSGVKNIAKAMETHPRAQKLNMNACAAITALCGQSEEFREQLLDAHASKLVAKALAEFKSSLDFCVTSCLTLFTLASGHSHARTAIGGARGVWAILECLKIHEGDDITLSGLKAVHAITEDHRANQQIAATHGSIEALVEELREHQVSEEICTLACVILESLMDDKDEIRNQVKFYNAKGEEAVAECDASQEAKDSLLGVLQPKKAAKQTDGSDPPRTLGRDVYAYLLDEGNQAKHPKLMHTKRIREIVDQEIVMFTAEGKSADRVKKKRLLCVDRTDITVYGGPDEKDDNIFTKVITTYPLSKVTRIRIVPEHKHALYIECAHGVTGTVVTKSPKRAKEWRDILKKLCPLRLGPEGCKQTLMDGKKMNSARYLSWVGNTLQPPHMMLCVHEANKKGALTQVIELEYVQAVVAKKKVLELTVSSPDDADTVVENKWEIATVYEADLWESFIQQFLLEHAEGKERIRYQRVREAEKAATTALIVDEPEPEPEPEPEVEEEEEEEEESELPEGVPLVRPLRVADFQGRSFLISVRLGHRTIRCSRRRSSSGCWRRQRSRSCSRRRSRRTGQRCGPTPVANAGCLCLSDVHITRCSDAYDGEEEEEDGGNTVRTN